ncbi:N-alpha-acetyltransferase 30 [Tilletia horrida]|nr:N-alpha-acetyltransferase 30 [Tilletia horrida]
MATTLPPFASTSGARSVGAPADALHFPPPPPDDNAFEYDIELVTYAGEHHLSAIIALIEKELSEPYLIYTYRYFLNEWPHLAWLAHLIPRRRPPPLPPRSSQDKPSRTPVEAAALGSQIDSLTLDAATANREEKRQDALLEEHSAALRRAPVGVIVNKIDRHLKGDRLMRGYIAMLSIHPAWRKKGIARTLVQAAIDRMARDGAQEIVLETEVDNSGALALYESLGFIREKRLYRFYLNAKDSFRLVLPIVEDSDSDSDEQLQSMDSAAMVDRPATPRPANRLLPERPARSPSSPWKNQVYDFDGLIM